MKQFAILIVIACAIYLVIKNFIKNKMQKNALPVIGIPNREKINVLLLLFHLRCAEIAEIYCRVRGFQKLADHDNWLRNFLKDFYLNVYMTHNSYRKYENAPKETQEAIEKNYDNIISTLLHKKFNLDHLKHGATNDLITILKSNCDIDIIQRLKSIKTYGFLENTISYLIGEYGIFHKACSKDSFVDVFILDKKWWSPLRPTINQAEYNIDTTWNEIILALKASLMYSELTKEKNINRDQLLKEIDALKSMTWGLDWLIAQKNTTRRYGFNAPREAEELIYDLLEATPIGKFKRPMVVQREPNSD